MTIRNGQQTLLALIEQHTKKFGLPPSYPELAKYLGVTTGAIVGRLKTLERLGLVAWEYNKPRTLRVDSAAINRHFRRSKNTNLKNH